MSNRQATKLTCQLIFFQKLYTPSKSQHGHKSRLSQNSIQFRPKSQKIGAINNMSHKDFRGTNDILKY